MATETFAPGTELFGYRIKATLGRGGMGTVYHAVQLSLGREVALKVLHPSRIRNQDQIDCFLKEARSAARLSHPGLVAIHDAHANPDHGQYCYSMEYVPGSTLAKLIKECGTLPRGTALQILHQAAKALGHAHRHALVHRDVKPDNLLVTPQGTVKLADLGLVRDRLEGIPQTSAGGRILSVVGTPDYTAPEQSRNPAKAGPESDLYSLGACLFAMLTGRPPFNGETLIDLIVRAATEDVAYPADFPSDCQQICGILLAKHPGERYADGDELAAALERLAKGQALPEPALRDGDATEEETAVEIEAAARPVQRPLCRRIIRRHRR